MIFLPIVKCIFIKQISHTALWQFFKDEKFWVETKIMKLIKIKSNRWNNNKNKTQKISYAFLSNINLPMDALQPSKTQAPME